MSKAKFAYDKLYGTSLKETAVGDYISELEKINSDLMQDRNNLMSLISECIELDYFKDEAILILHEIVVKHSTK